MKNITKVCTPFLIILFFAVSTFSVLPTEYAYAATLLPSDITATSVKLTALGVVPGDGLYKFEVTPKVTPNDDFQVKAINGFAIMSILGLASGTTYTASISSYYPATKVSTPTSITPATFKTLTPVTSNGPGGTGNTPVTSNGPSYDINATKITNPIGIKSINGFIKKVLEGVIKIGIPIIALAIIYSGFLYISARGNSEKIEKAHMAILYTLVGAGLVLGSWALAQLISDTVLAL